MTRDPKRRQRIGRPLSERFAGPLPETIAAEDVFYLELLYKATFVALQDALRAQHPGKNEEEIGELMGEKIQASLEEVARGRVPSEAFMVGHERGLGIESENDS